MSFFIIIYLFFNIFKFVDTLVSFQFKTFHPKLSIAKKEINEFNSQDFAESILLSKICFELIIGNETTEKTNKNQILNIFPVSDYKFYIKSFQSFDIPEENRYFCNYSQILSETFNKINIFRKLGEESFQIYRDIYLTNKQYINLQFYDDKISEEKELLCGQIGIDASIFRIDDTNFIPQIINKFKESYKTYIIKYNYNTPDEGQIIIGDMPHNYLSKEYNETNLIDFKSGNNRWSLIMDNLILEGYNISSSDLFENIEVYLSFDHDGLVFSEIYIEYLDKIYFNKYYEKNICKNETIFVYNRAYTIVSCNASHFGKDDINQFPKIIFIRYRTNLNFTFEGNELFYYKDNKYFFKIFKESSKAARFEFGRIFLRKYLTVFNFEAKKISFYKNKENKEDENNEGINNFLWKIILIISLVVIFIFLGLGIFIGKKIYQKRIKRANELDDDNYLYDPNIINENGKEKLFNEENKEQN